MESSLLRRFVAGQCGEAEQAEVELHLARCRSCQLAYARTRGYLHDVAGGLAVAASAAGGTRLGTLLGLPTRIEDATTQRVQSVAEATRAARERIRDMVLRLATGTSGVGGDATAGQALAATSVKVASACAATVAVGACVAAGVVPGIAGFGSVTSHPHPGTEHSSRHAESRAAGPPPATLVDPLPEATSASTPPEKPKAKLKKRSPKAAEGGSRSRTPSPAPSESSSAPKELSEVSNGEFFDETGEPVSPPSSSGSSGSGAASSPSGSAASSPSKESGEFGM
jgi:hypothetical protein